MFSYTLPSWIMEVVVIILRISFCADGRGALGRVETPQTAARTCADIEEASPILERPDDIAYRQRDRGDFPGDNCRDFSILRVDQAKGIVHRGKVDPHRLLVAAFGREGLELPEELLAFHSTMV